MKSEIGKNFGHNDIYFTEWVQDSKYIKGTCKL